MKSIPKETYGIIENVLATIILSIPNFFFYFLIKDSFLVMAYSSVIMFVIISAMSHKRFAS